MLSALLALMSLLLALLAPWTRLCRTVFALCAYHVLGLTQEMLRGRRCTVMACMNDIFECSFRYRYNRLAIGASR